MREFDPHYTRLLRRMSRQVMAKIWQAGQAGEPLEGDDELLYQIMRDHPEYHDLWDTIDYVVDREVVIDGVNPFLHVTMHHTIESQFREGNPPEVRDAILRLLHRGYDRHEAIHRVAHVFAVLLWEALREEGPVSMEKYRKRLKEL